MDLVLKFCAESPVMFNNIAAV